VSDLLTEWTKIWRKNSNENRRKNMKKKKMSNPSTFQSTTFIPKAQYKKLKIARISLTWKESGDTDWWRLLQRTTTLAKRRWKTLRRLLKTSTRSSISKCKGGNLLILQRLGTPTYSASSPKHRRNEFQLRREALSG